MIKHTEDTHLNQTFFKCTEVIKQAELLNLNQITLKNRNNRAEIDFKLAPSVCFQVQAG